MLGHARPEQPCRGQCVYGLSGSPAPKLRVAGPRHQLGRVGGNRCGRRAQGGSSACRSPACRQFLPSKVWLLLEALLDRGECQVGAFGMDWRAYARGRSRPGGGARWSGNSQDARRQRSPRPTPEKRRAGERVFEPPRPDQAGAGEPAPRAAGARFVEERVVKALGLDPSRPPDRSRPLQELGLDSLLAVELRNVLSNGLGLPRRLPATLLFDYPSVAAITDYLASELLPAEEQSVVPAAALEIVRRSWRRSRRSPTRKPKPCCWKS